MTVFCVAGLGRCGSSLTMQMLAAGGMPCVGDFPDFEVDEVNNAPSIAQQRATDAALRRSAKTVAHGSASVSGEPSK